MEILLAILGGGALISVIGNIILFGLQRKAAKEDKKDEGKDMLKAHDAAIQDTQEELALLTFGILACLKGVHELGANGPVTEAITRIEKHLNTKAHGG